MQKVESLQQDTGGATRTLSWLSGMGPWVLVHALDTILQPLNAVDSVNNAHLSWHAERSRIAEYGQTP